MQSKFDFFDIVIVNSKKKKLAIINGREGIIQGKSQSEEDPRVFAYAVDLLDDSGAVIDGWFIFEEDLQPTGKKAKKEDFYTGESIKVRVDPKTGEGEIVEDEES